MVLYQVAYEHEASGVKSLKIQTFSRCKEGTIVYEPVKDLAIDNIPSPGLETVHVLLYVRLLSSRTERVGVVVTFEVLIGLILIGSRSALSLRKKQKATDNLHR